MNLQHWPGEKWGPYSTKELRDDNKCFMNNFVASSYNSHASHIAYAIFKRGARLLRQVFVRFMICIFLLYNCKSRLQSFITGRSHNTCASLCMLRRQRPDPQACSRGAPS